MIFRLMIEDASFPDTKDVRMSLYDGVGEEWKHLRRQIFCNFLPRELVKKDVKEKIIEAIGNELEKYIDKAFEEKKD